MRAPGTRWRPLFGLVLVALLALVPRSVQAQGGPPLLTDDPDTPGPGYWEINVSTLVEKNGQERRVEIPRLDLNYGVGRRIQLKYEVPWVALRPSGEPSRTGLGSSVAGVKWRFLGREGRRVAWSVYPQLEFNTSPSSAANGVAEPGHQLLLPTEITLELSHLEFNAELGRNFVPDEPDHWIYGLATEAGISKRLELVAEVHGEGHAPEPAEIVLNVGGRQKLNRKMILMLALGRAVHGSPEERRRLLFYAGLQLDLPGFYDVTAPTEHHRH